MANANEPHGAFGGKLIQLQVKRMQIFKLIGLIIYQNERRFQEMRMANM